MSSVPATDRSTPKLLAAAEILRIAHQDGIKAYRDLSQFRITMEPRPDGWHVDFDLIDTNLAGGGPHYVIDATTGAISSKVYEQ